MCKYLITALMFWVLNLSALLSQVAPTKTKALIQAGVGFQTINSNFRFSFISIETGFSPYFHMGVVGSLYHPELSNAVYYFDYNPVEGLIDKHSYEVGVFGKYYMHGRFTGRKSSLYFGPDMRFGSRKFVIKYFNPNVLPFPDPTNIERLTRNVKTSKFMVNWGWHLDLKPVAIEFSFPFGVEVTSSNFQALPGYYPPDDDGTKLTILPMISMGYQF